MHSSLLQETSTQTLDPKDMHDHIDRLRNYRHLQRSLTTAMEECIKGAPVYLKLEARYTCVLVCVMQAQCNDTTVNEEAKHIMPEAICIGDNNGIFLTESVNSASKLQGSSLVAEMNNGFRMSGYSKIEYSVFQVANVYCTLCTSYIPE